MSACYKCGKQWTNDNKIETPLLCPECISLAAPAGSAVQGLIDAAKSLLEKGGNITRRNALQEAVRLVEVGTISDAIDEYKTTRTSSATKLLNRLLGELIGLKCPHCGGNVPVTIESANPLNDQAHWPLI